MVQTLGEMHWGWEGYGEKYCGDEGQVFGCGVGMGMNYHPYVTL